MERFQSASHVARSRKPDVPVLCRRPGPPQQAARWFGNAFPGRVFYAVKANPAEWLLGSLAAAGIDHFDVASIGEARLVRRLFPHAVIGFMHPVKPAGAIAEAYHRLGIRIFAVDSHEELARIRAATDGAQALTLCVRLAVPGGTSKIPLNAKFGVASGPDAGLLQATRQAAERLVISFHVGSQTMAPSTYRAALASVQSAIVRAGVFVDAVDVGGGFPAPYPGMVPPPPEAFVRDIVHGFQALSVSDGCELWCEPGRALAAEAESLLVRVEERRGDTLYLNDGIYGTLFDAGPMGWRYPVRLAGRPGEGGLRGYSFYGPTCDDFDHMAGPFHLPADICSGDHVEIGNIGAYGRVMRTKFNGFAFGADARVDDPPMMSQFDRTAPAAQEVLWSDEHVRSGHDGGQCPQG